VRTEQAARGQLGRLTLNSPATLNSLTLEMVDLLQGALDAWRDDPSSGGLIVIDGAGEKAFCAGGDVQALHASAVGTPGGPCEYAESFFEREYRMNYTLHTYPKPILCWGHGIVMGGGLGHHGRLLAPRGHRGDAHRHAGGHHCPVSRRRRQLVPQSHARVQRPLSGPDRGGRQRHDALFCGLADRFIAAADRKTRCSPR
jgi:hypothetical protein